MKNITTIQLRKTLSNKSEKELIEDIINLFSKIPQVKEYYTLTFSDAGEDSVLEKYKKIVTNEFFPTRGYGKLKLSVARKAISDFKKISKKSSSVADIMLHYVEQGVGFTNQYGDIDGPFYDSMEKMFTSTMTFIEKYDLLPEFKERCESVIDDACEGWGFKCNLSEIYDEACQVDNKFTRVQRRQPQ